MQTTDLREKPRFGPLLGLLAGCALLAGAWAPTVAQAQRVDTTRLQFIETELGQLERRYLSLRAELSAGSLTRSPRLISERYREARYAYLVEDYERCALIFYSLLENDDLRADPRKPEGEWYLAECLFLDGNLLPAQREFRGIVDTGPDHAFYSDSLLKLIEIYGRTGEVREFNYYYNNFILQSRDNSPTSLRIRYEMGRTLYRQGKLPEAQAIFGAFPRGSTYTPQAGYHSGVILVRQGQESLDEAEDLEVQGRAQAAGQATNAAIQKFQSAIRVFLEVETLPISTSAHEQVRDLTRLAIARLHYQNGKIPEAVGHYSRIASDSPMYSDALYELIWATIEAASQQERDFDRTRKYEEALRAIEIFNLAFPGDVREPALRLLGAHVRVRMEDYEEAIERYELAGEKFRGLKRIVDEIVGSDADSMVYFNQLVDDDKFVAEADLTVPEEAKRQAAADERVSEAVRISGDLYRQQEAIDDADILLSLLEEALYGSESVDLIQTYRLHRQQLSTADAASLLLRNRLVEFEMEYLAQVLPASSRGAIDAIQSARENASNSASGLALARQRTLDKSEHFTLQAQAVSGRLYTLELVVNDLLSRLVAMEEYLVDARNRGERTRESELEARKEIDRERSELNGVKAILVPLRRRLEPRLLTGRMLAESASDEGRMRREAGTSVSSVESRLSGLRRNADGDPDVLRRVDSARSRILALAGQAGETRRLLDDAEGREIGEIKREVDFQRRMVRNLDGEGEGIARDNERVSGRIGKQAFAEVAGFYEDMLTRADMGVSDVYWYRKEQTSQQRKSLLREKVKRLKALKKAFGSVLEEDES
jgi:tetratricopeptide (TPR) repeat protein